MPSRRTYPQDTIDAIARRFDAAPAVATPARYSSFALVQKLLPKIQAMTRNGYSWEAIARMMGEDGVHLSPNALRKYVAHGQDKRRPKKNAQASQTGAASKAPPGQKVSSNPGRPVGPGSAPSAFANDDDWNDLDLRGTESPDSELASVPRSAPPSRAAAHSRANPMNAPTAASVGTKPLPSSGIQRELEEI